MNEDQVRFWNEAAGGHWTRLQATIDRNLSRIHDAILAFAAPAPGMTVLDIGCGTGTTSLALVETVGPQGRVLGLDVSAPMLGLAKARGVGKANLDFALADASAADLGGPYDLLFSRFGVMFFDEPVPAFAHLRAALKPGRRLAFACWRTPAENLWASAPMAAASPFLPKASPPDSSAPGPFAFADAARIRDILTQAGFGGIAIERFDGVMPMGRDLHLAAAQTLEIGPLSRAAGEADDETRSKIAVAARGALQPFVTADGEIVPPVACWLVSAKG